MDDWSGMLSATVSKAKAKAKLNIKNKNTSEISSSFSKTKDITQNSNKKEKLGVFTICNNQFVEGCKTMLYSFLRHNKWFKEDIIIAYSEEQPLSNENQEYIKELYDKIIFKKYDLTCYEKLFDHWNNKIQNKYRPSILTLEIFGLVDYDRIIYIDSDMLILGSIQELINLPQGPVYACCHEKTTIERNTKFKYSHPYTYINAGFFVITKPYIGQDIKNNIIKIGETFKFSGSKWFHSCFEQDILNQYLSTENCILIPNVYNTLKRVFQNNKRQVSNEKIIHYICEKPWNSNSSEYQYIDALWHRYNDEMNKVQSEKIALCAIAKLEHNYIVEWVEHYKSIGFDHIYIYDNNDSEEFSFKNVLKSYIDSDYVTLIPCYKKAKYQKQAYTEFYKNNKDKYNYIAYFDLDEFLILHKTNDIHEYLSNPKFINFDSICINYKTFGDSDLLTVENNDYNCLTRFTKPVFKESEKYNNKGYKKIVKTDVILNSDINHVHFISKDFSNQCNNAGTKCNVSGKDDVKHSFLNNSNVEDAQLNHYCTKTLEEYVIKITRGGGVSGQNGYNIKQFFKTNKFTADKENLIKRMLNNVDLIKLKEL